MFAVSSLQRSLAHPLRSVAPCREGMLSAYIFLSSLSSTCYGATLWPRGMSLPVLKSTLILIHNNKAMGL